MSIRVDWGFKTIPVKTILFAGEGEDKLESQGLGMATGIILTNNGHP